MPKFTLRQRARYWFDNTMSKGAPALIAWLALATLALIVVGAVVTIVVAPNDPDGEQRNFPALIWNAFLHALDPGTIAGDQDSFAFVAAMFLVTIGGIFVLSALIGVITTGLDARLDELRKGRSIVVETGHTLILGWSDQVFKIISELVVANESERRGCVVVLADEDKVMMEEEIRRRVPATRNTKVVCRSGSPMEMGDLDIANPQQAKSIIVLAPDGDEPDAQVIKILLAITNSPTRRRDPYHVVAGVAEARNLHAAQLAGGPEALVVDTGDIAARLIVQTCRQSGLSVVYTELLDYDGDEIYMQEEPRLLGRSYGEALLWYRTCTLMGILRADGQVLLNPPSATRFDSGDRVIVLAEDDDRVVLSSEPVHVTEQAIAPPQPGRSRPEHTLVLGWNRRAVTILRELDAYVAAGSVLHVVAEHPELEAHLLRHTPSFRNLTIDFKQEDITSREALDGLEVDAYDHVIVLCDSDHLDPTRADARTLVTLLHLRDMQTRAGTRYPVVSEILDDRTRQLAEVTQADDFIVGDKLISLLLTQLSENRSLYDVFTDLLDPDGSEIYLKPAPHYVRPGVAVSFATVVEAARRRGETAMGYRLQQHATNPEHAYGVVLNPDKSATVALGEGDRVVVLAED